MPCENTPPAALEVSLFCRLTVVRPISEEDGVIILEGATGSWEANVTAFLF